jgi:OmcA/MtrC family decaheme c-type cytochrome
MSKRLLVLMCSIFLVVPLLFMGCSGDDGAPGAPGKDGSNAVPLSAGLNLESCAICHDDQNVRNGDAHQADYDTRFQDNVVVVSNIAYTYNATDNQHIVTFNVTKDGQDFDCTQTSTLAKDPRTGTTEDSLGIAFAEYIADNTSFVPPSPLKGSLTLGTQGTATAPSTLSYTAGTNLCTSTVNDNVLVDNVVTPVGNLALRNGVIVVYGRDDVNGALPSPARVVLSVFPFANLVETGTAGVDYVSAANVTGCEKCHTVPFLKHGYIYGRVAGNPATDFITCKACHLDTVAGGHVDWQLLVDDPPLSVRYIDGVTTTAENAQIAAKYAYKRSLMNDVHMSHAMEFAYPQSMGNCATCHEGKLTATLSDNNFTIETCKSCHPVTGGTDLPDADGDFTVDTRTKNALNKQAPALAGLWAAKGVAGFHNVNSTCTTCHSVASGAASVFSVYHTGYDKVIYGDAIGTKYSTAITVTIDNASFVDNTNTLTFGFHATGTLGGLSSANITPTILVGLYGYDTKDYLFGPHERTFDDNGDGIIDSSDKRDLEAVAGTTHPRITTTSPAPGTWNVTANLSTWNGWIDNGSVKRVEVALLPNLKNADNVAVALNAPSRTFNLVTKAFEPNFFGNSIVKVTAGKAADGNVSGCNNCHDALATTFHSADRGGNVVVCRLCHITKAAGSHLELQSRSIDSYAHAIHRFQAFDTGDIDFTDPVEALHYEHHVESNFPTFGIENCRACHNAGKFNVPNQGLSLPGVLSNTDFGTVRNIGTIKNDVITGPATRACGACHRAEAIIANAGAGDAIKLANINSHMTTFGYMIEDSTPSKILDVIVQIFSSFGDNGTILVGP